MAKVSKSPKLETIYFLFKNGEDVTLSPNLGLDIQINHDNSISAYKAGDSYCIFKPGMKGRKVYYKNAKAVVRVDEINIQQELFENAGFYDEDGEYVITHDPCEICDVLTRNISSNTPIDYIVFNFNESTRPKIFPCKKDYQIDETKYVLK